VDVFPYCHCVVCNFCLTNLLITHHPPPFEFSSLTGAPRAWLCQVAVAIIQTAFVVGSVYLKGSLSLVDASKGEKFSPLVYAFFREVTAGPLLYAIAWISTGVAYPARQDIWRVFALGACMFLSQLFYIVGIELSGVTVATCFQPAIPVFTVLLGILLQMETASPQKLVGVILAVSGAVCMVLGGVAGPAGGQNMTEAAAAAAGTRLTIGNTCLLVNTLAMASYYILGKKMLAKYSPAQVSAWAYLVAATLMGSAASVFTVEEDWHFPKALVLPLAYWVLVCSVGGYYIVTWAMCHLPASQVASFQCLQPFLGSLLAFLVLHEQPTWYDLGAVGVLAGLILVSTDKKDSEMRFMMARVRAVLARAMMSSRTFLAPIKEVE